MISTEVKNAIRTGFAGSPYKFLDVVSSGPNAWDVHIQCPTCGPARLLIIENGQQSAAELVNNKLGDHDRHLAL